MNHYKTIIYADGPNYVMQIKY